MVEQDVINDMADYIVKLSDALNKRNHSIALTQIILGIFVFHQFNGTRNDTKFMFDHIIKELRKDTE